MKMPPHTQNKQLGGVGLHLLNIGKGFSKKNFLNKFLKEICQHPRISLRIPPLLTLFMGFEGGVSLAPQNFLGGFAPQTPQNQEKIGACGGLAPTNPQVYL